MSTQFGYDHDEVNQCISIYQTEKEKGGNLNEKRLSLAKQQLRRSLIPLYENLFDTIIKQKHGMKFIVDMRKDLLVIL